MIGPNLRDLGWSDFFADGFHVFAGRGLIPGRVVVQHRGVYQVCFVEGEFAAEVPGRFRHEARGASDFPAVGDWVAAQIFPEEGKAMIHAVLARRTKFSRTAPGDAGEEQVLAANIDDVFVVESLAGAVNLRRMERFLTLAWESGARPTILLTKADLCNDVTRAVAEAETVAAGAAVLAVSNITGQGLDAVREQIPRGRTATLFGPSGVGKSTLINQLCGEELQFVQPVRERDQKGRHTTSHRELITLPNGGLIIDTPGLRELQLWDGAQGLEEGFSDIELSGQHCRFSDCQHNAEPGCAVLEAVQRGELDPGRLESYRKLKRELAWFQRRHDARAQAEERRRIKGATRALRNRVHQKRKS